MEDTKPKNLINAQVYLEGDYASYDDLEEIVQALVSAMRRKDFAIKKLSDEMALMAQQHGKISTTYANKKELDPLRADIQKVSSQIAQETKNIQKVINSIEKFDPTDILRAISKNTDDIEELIRVSKTIGETSESIRNKLETLNGKERLSVKAIDGLEDEIKRLLEGLSDSFAKTLSTRTKIGGGNVEVYVAGNKIGSGQGINFASGFTVTHDGHKANVTATGGGGGGYTLETPTGAVNGSNTSFTCSDTPAYIVADGITYFENFGYTLSGLNVTMTTPPTLYIRAFI